MMNQLIAQILLVGLGSTAVTVSAQELTPQQAGQYMAAVGQVLGTQAAMKALTTGCGEAAPQLGANWNKRNRVAIDKAEKLRALVLKNIERSEGIQAARAFEEKQDRMLNEKAANAVREVRALPSEKRVQTCRTYSETLSAGQYDISKNASLYSLLMSAK